MSLPSLLRRLWCRYLGSSRVGALCKGGWQGLLKPRQAPRSPGVRLRVEGLEDRLVPSTLTVTNYTDPPNEEPGTLRSAVITANADAARGVSDTIKFSPHLTSDLIELTQGDLELTPGKGRITINGGGKIQLSGGNSNRLFVVDYGAIATLKNMTLEDGYVSGGTFGNGGALYIYGHGNVQLIRCDFESNFTTGDGAAISNDGTLKASYCSFSNNQADIDGGAIFNDSAGTLTVSGSRFLDNSATLGGAIDNSNVAHLTVSACTFENNTAYNMGGGAIADDGALTISGSKFTGNTAEYAGGALYITSHGTLKVSSSTFDHNSTVYANGDGGAIFTDGTSLTCSLDHFTDNSATDAGGAIYNFLIGTPTQKFSHDTYSGNSAPTGDNVYTTI